MCSLTRAFATQMVTKNARRAQSNKNLILLHSDRPNCIVLASLSAIGFKNNFAYAVYKYSKTCVKRPLSRRPEMVFKTDYHLMQVKSIAECSKGSILQYFRPSLMYQLSFKTFVLIIFEWLFNTGFTVLHFMI